MTQHRVRIRDIAVALNDLSTEIEKQGQFMMVKKTKEPEEIIQFASMWNMDGLVVLGFCHQDYTYLRNHMRMPFVIYDGICSLCIFSVIPGRMCAFCHFTGGISPKKLDAESGAAG